MSDSAFVGRITSVRAQIRRERLRWYSAYVTVMLITFGLAVLAWRSAPGAFSIAFAAMLVTGVAWMIKPLAGLHLTVFFTMLGDSVTVRWFPFTKDLSSQESLLFISHQIKFSPLEAILAFGLVCWMIRHIARHDHPVVKGPLFRPVMVFTGFVVLGFLYGMARGGDLRIALFEGRALLYLPVLYFLISNTCHTARQFHALLWTALIAVFGLSLIHI